MGHAPGLSQRQHRRLARSGDSRPVRLVSLLAPPLCTACRAAGGAAAPCSAPGLPARARVPRARAGPARRPRPSGRRSSYEGPARAIVRRLKFAPRDRAGRPHGGHDRRERARGPARAPARAGARRRPPGGARAASATRPCSPRRSPPAPGSPSCRCSTARARAPRQVGRARGQRLRAPPGFSGRSGGRPRRSSWWTTWSPPGPLSARAHRLCAEKGWHCGHAVAYARTPVR